MNVTIDPQWGQFIGEKIRVGQFTSSDEVISSALALMRQQEELTEEDIAELRREIVVGIEQLERGESAPWDPVEMKERLRRRLNVR